MIKADALQTLTQMVDRRDLITDPVELLVYEIDATQERAVPDGAVLPKSAEQVCKLVRWAAENRVPLVARGAGTGLSGGALAEHGGIIVEFSHMNRIVEMDSVGRSVIVEPGIINLALDASVKKLGLYYPPDPASGRSATIGGNIAENAGGPHCFKYGVTSNYVTGLQVALPDGRLVQLGGSALDYPEYDFVSLVTGSEGTLGLVTRANLRLIRNPPGVKTMMAAFNSIAEAGQAVSDLIADGLVPATMELMDQRLMRIVEEFSHAGLPVEAGAMLIIEVDGYQVSLDAQVNQVVQILERDKAFNIRVAQTPEESAKIWYGRKSAAGCMAKLAPAYFLVDGTVPRSRLAETLDQINEICASYKLNVAYVAHAGDGNLHPFIPFFPSDPDQVARGWKACEDIMRVVADHEGSITGEHGVGMEKREFMKFMYDGAELAAMRDIKRAFDPQDMMNPGKIFPKQMPEVKRVAPNILLDDKEFTPTSAQETAAGLAELTSSGTKALINKKGPKSVTISTRALNGVRLYAPNDLYITLGAGTTLEQAQEFLEPKGRQIPLVSPWPETTFGGIVAGNLNSPQRMRYGSVRDLLLSCTVALPDGRLIRAGRAVVKNVAGYDMPKLFVGSHGTLGVLVDATFKLVPLPRVKRTLLVPIEDIKQGMNWGSQLLQTALVASAIVVAKGVSIPEISSPYVLAYSAEGVAEDVETEMTQVRQLLQKLNTPEPVQASLTGTDLWRKVLQGGSTQSLTARVGVSSKDLGTYVADHVSVLNNGAYIADIASGLIHAVAKLEDVGAAQKWLDALRQPALKLNGYAIVDQMPDEWRDTLDRWGYKPQASDVMRTLRNMFDPAGIMNADGFMKV